MKQKLIKPAIFTLLAITFLFMGFYACNKDDGYGSGGGNNTGDKVSIKNFAFSAGNLTVDAGTTVTWTNNDGATHTVTADDNSFDSGNIAPGGTYTHTFSSAGTFNYHCNIHTTMTAKVTVN